MNPAHPSLRLALLAWVMHLANQDSCDQWFALKRRLLIRFGVRDGFDLQDLIKHCRECNGAGYISPDPDHRFRCRRCRDGIYARTFNQLHRWQVQGWLFHTPERVYSQVAADYLRDEARSVITTVKQYRRGFPRLAREAQLWLLFVFDRHLWRSMMVVSCYLKWWPILPMNALNRAAFWLHHTRLYKVYDFRHRVALRAIGLITSQFSPRNPRAASVVRWIQRRLFPKPISCRYHRADDALNEVAAHLDLWARLHTGLRDDMPF